MAEQRPFFIRQPARLLLVDATPPFDNVTCTKLTRSMKNFFTLACSLSGPSRLPLFGLTALGAYPEVLYAVQNVRGNYVRLCAALGELETCVRDHYERASGQPCVGRGMREAANMFKRQSQNMLQMAGYWAQMELTIVTCRNPTSVLREVDQSVRELNMDSLKKTQVLYINNAERVMVVDSSSDSTPSQASSSSRDSDDIGGLIECVTLEEDVLCMENFFKAWLQDNSTDMEHLHLILSSEPGEDLILKCDLHERLLSPHHLPLTSKLTVTGDEPPSGRSGAPTSARAAGSQHVPLHKLRVVQKVPADGVCESVLFGLPVIVRATTCWKIDWDDLESNQQHFNALCHLLKEKNQCLLTATEQSVPTKSNSGFRYQVSSPAPPGYFLLLPSYAGALLLKAIGVSELTMPCSLGEATLNERPPEESLSVVTQALDKIKEQASYNPMMVSNGLYQSLEGYLTKGQPGGVHNIAKRKSSYKTSDIQPASSLLLKPSAKVCGRNASQKEQWDDGHVTGPANKRRQRQESGRDFYSKNTSSFPTEL